MRPPAWTVFCATAALLGLLGGCVAAELAQAPGYDPVRSTISALAKHGAQDRWIMTCGMCVIGIAHLGTAAGLSGLRAPARILLALGGVAGLGIAVCAQPVHGSTDAHLAFAALGLVVMALFPFTVVRRGANVFPLRIRDAAIAGCVSLLLFAWIAQAARSGTLGLAERVITFQQNVWPLLVVLALRREFRRMAASLTAREVATISA